MSAFWPKAEIDTADQERAKRLLKTTALGLALFALGGHRDAPRQQRKRHEPCLYPPQNQARLASAIFGQYERRKLGDAHECDDRRERYRFHE
jgi:hypothetical protein